MTIQQLRYFIELAHTHNYSLAAERTFVTQPTLSYAISQLEEELGIKLFLKNGRNNVLTDHGKRFLNYAEGALKTLDAGVDDINSRIHGEIPLRVGSLRYLGVHYIPKLVSDFKAAYPEYKIKVTYETGSTALLLDGLNSGRFDVVFCAPSRKIGETPIIVHKQKLYLIVPKGHELCGRKSITMEDAAKYPFVYYAKGSSMRNIIYKSIGDMEQKLNVNIEVMEEQVAVGFVAAGFGVTISPANDSIATLPVEMIEIEEPVLQRNIYMVPTINGEITPVIKMFVKYAKAHPYEKELIVQ